VRKYGKGSWKRILQDEGLTFDQRSATDLKDKWRNLEKRREEYERELDAMGEDDEEGEARPAAPAARKPSKGGGKRELEEVEEVEDSDKDRVVKKEPALKKQQPSPTASQIRESALEARKKRMQQLSGAAAGPE
jgi:peptidoglycan hydrolase CwlO-like protein